MEQESHSQPHKPWSPGYIYVIDYGDGKTFKIGTTKNSPHKRLGEISRGNVLMPMHLVMYMYAETNARYIENLLHMRYDDSHIDGEWFTLDFMDLVNMAQALKTLVCGRLFLTDRWFDELVPGDWQTYIEHYGIHPHYPEFERKLPAPIPFGLPDLTEVEL